LAKEICTKEKVNDLNIAYIGGGSMNWAWELMSDLALEPQLSGVVRLYDIHYDAAKANEKIGNLLKDDPKALGKWTYEAKATLKDTLTGADFVVISILPGTFDEMESDVHGPEKYGIYQSVGDTVGPGGILRAMRTIPMYAEIAEAIKAYSPSAWVINYTNPMSVCMGTLYRVFPDIKAFGCCHEVFHMQKLMAKMLSLECGIEDISRDDIRLNLLGVNHFVWIDQASYKTMDLMPLFDQFAAKYADSGFALDESDRDPTNTFRNNNKICFDLYRRYGVIPGQGDRHTAEFMPPWYLKNPETVKQWGFDLTKVSGRKKMRVKKLEQSAAIIAGREKFEIEPSGEEGIKQMKALLGLSEMVTNVNFPNRGQIASLPIGMIADTNAIFEKNAVRPIFAGSLPPTVNMLVSKHAENQKTIIEAGLSKDLSLAFSVFLNDNLMTLGLRDAEKLFNEMVDNTKAYLQGWSAHLKKK